MNFPLIFKGAVALLAAQAENAFSDPKQGAAKKQWVLDQLRAMLVKAKLHPILVTILVEGVAPFVIEWVMDEVKELLGK